MTTAIPPATIPLNGIQCRINGYGSMIADVEDTRFATTTPEYANAQEAGNTQKALDFILPLVAREKASSVLDVGCGIGVMVKTLLNKGFDAYGADLIGLQKYWEQQQLPFDRLVIVDAANTKLPFESDTIDFAFTLGAIEHIGTSDGHADRLINYREIRKSWLLEVLRVVKVGGTMLVGGPNRNFPVDVAHGLDSRASNLEKALSRLAKASIHRPWGENFLWGYRDLRDYLQGENCSIEPLSIRNFLGLSRVPKIVRPLISGYLKHLPRTLLGTPLNPWMVALVRKGATASKSH